MEIIKNGNIPVVKTNIPDVNPVNKYITTCSKCGCVFTYTKNDRYKAYDVPNYGGLIGSIIDCPCCSTQIPFGHGKKIKL